MTDKQIIIDGIDVSGCIYYEDGKCLNGEMVQCNCKKVAVCYYKEYKRKEQECEELKENLPNAITRLMGELDQLKAENEVLKQYKASKQASYESMQREWNEAVNENRELKAENEELKDKNNRLTILGMDLNQSNEVLRKSFFQTDKSRDKWREQAEKYSKALAEIKEIAEPYQKEIKKICGNCNNYDDCHACCKFDLNCYQYKKGDTTACEKFIVSCEYDKNELANKILQKISEVVDAN